MMLVSRTRAASKCDACVVSIVHVLRVCVCVNKAVQGCVHSVCGV